MERRRPLGRQFEALWAAYAVSALGTWLAFDAFALLAIQVLDAGPRAVSGLTAAGLAVAAAVALPVGPWVEFHRKRPVMIAMDLLRCAMLLSVPAAYAVGALTYAQLLAVVIVVGAADITFGAASGATLKAIVRKEDLLLANGRFESTNWTVSMLGPPLGGAAVGLFGPVVTVLANAVSFLLSAVGIRAMGRHEAPPARPDGHRPRLAELFEGWRHILTHPVLRPLFCHVLLANGLVMATMPLMAVRMLGQLGFAPWQYGLAFAAPCVGGLLGARLVRPLVARFGQHSIMLAAGVSRAPWLIGLAFVGPGTAGLALVIAVELGLITCSAVFSPVSATIRLQQIPTELVARTLTAWSIGTKLSIAGMTALWGLLAGFTGSQVALVVAGLLMLATPLALPRREHASAEPDFAYDTS
ncbi:MFS transporter [Nocardia tenerifensis]|uniref:MFS transporter n=1 Tax=Nocardia tenerifensis TaxID=228006 RepID=A0A318JSY6_9NOCA|nr:MFS transporter [Nocardia tenerifensis]PXX59636.1 MFS transporter [Nocardia tenerifensis]